jgi:hypothetical protein
MGVDVDESGRDVEAGGVDGFGGFTGRGGYIANRGDPLAGDSNVGLFRRYTCSVDYRSAPNNYIECQVRAPVDWAVCGRQSDSASVELVAGYAARWGRSSGGWVEYLLGFKRIAAIRVQPKQSNNSSSRPPIFIGINSAKRSGGI